MSLTIIRIKPNPTGKDRPPHGGPTAEQLAAEWVDFKNDTGNTLTLMVSRCTTLPTRRVDNRRGAAS